MDMETFAQNIEALRPKLYRTAFCYFGDETTALDVLDEAVYRGLCASGKLREPKYFATWMTRILLNECHREQKRRSRFQAMDSIQEPAAEELDDLSLQDAILRLPKDLKEVVVLRFFSGFTLSETAEALNIPQGTAATRQRRALNLLKLELEVEA